MIICAAIKIEHTDVMGCRLEPLVVCGHRHGNCYEVIRCLDLSIDSMTEGFINHKGEFLARKEAYKHALECGQISNHNAWYRIDNKYPVELYSEDLY